MACSGFRCFDEAESATYVDQLPRLDDFWVE